MKNNSINLNKNEKIKLISKEIFNYEFVVESIAFKGVLDHNNLGGGIFPKFFRLLTKDRTDITNVVKIGANGCLYNELKKALEEIAINMDYLFHSPHYSKALTNSEINKTVAFNGLQININKKPTKFLITSNQYTLNAIGCSDFKWKEVAKMSLSGVPIHKSSPHYSSFLELAIIINNEGPTPPYVAEFLKDLIIQSNILMGIKTSR